MRIDFNNDHNNDLKQRCINIDSLRNDSICQDLSVLFAHMTNLNEEVGKLHDKNSFVSESSHNGR